MRKKSRNEKKGKEKISQERNDRKAKWVGEEGKEEERRGKERKNRKGKRNVRR